MHALSLRCEFELLTAAHCGSFYKKLGFQELLRLPDELVLGLRFTSMTPSPSTRPHLECGVIEGFYGRPWSQEQRTELFERMAAWDMSLFMYGPKDDKKVRAAWRDLYTAPQLAQLSDQVRACRAGGIEFMYAIAPGLDIAHSDAAEIQLLVRKLQQVWWRKVLRCGWFGLGGMTSACASACRHWCDSFRDFVRRYSRGAVPYRCSRLLVAGGSAVRSCQRCLPSSQ